MSYDLWVESPDAGFISTADLQAQLLSEGWETRILPYDAYWQDWSDYDVTATAVVGLLETNILLVAWKVLHPNAVYFAQLFAQNETKHLEALRSHETAFATCGISVSRTPPNSEGTQTEYHFQLSSRSNHLSWEFTHVIWELIAELSHGEALNPQADNPNL